MDMSLLALTVTEASACSAWEPGKQSPSDFDPLDPGVWIKAWGGLTDIWSSGCRWSLTMLNSNPKAILRSMCCFKPPGWTGVRPMDFTTAQLFRYRPERQKTR